VAAETERIT